MKIELKSLTLTNFKGIKQLQVNFGHETSISGANATGKTTLMDAFLWNLFGKDSTDRKDFGIKTLDKDGKEIPKQEHEVISKIAIWDADDNDLPRNIILQRTLREKWTKPRGQAELVYDGNETIYNVDGVPCTMKEYNDKVDSICKENLFKLLTNPAYFPALNWSLQRQSLFSLIPEVTKDEIMAAIPAKSQQQGKFDELLKILNSTKTLEDYRKQIGADIRRIKDELVLIPARIDEVKRGIPEAQDWPALENAIKDADLFITRKDEEKADKLKSVEAETSKRSQLQAMINSIKQQMTSIKYEVEDGIRGRTREAQTKKTEHDRYLSDYNDLIQKTDNNIKGYRLDMESLQGERTRLIDEWKAINAEQYTHVVPGTCPTCGQELPVEFKEKTEKENLDVWNSHKQARIETNTKKGKSIAALITQKQAQIDEATAKLEKLKVDLDAVTKGWEGDDIPSDKMGESGASPAALSFVAQVDAALKAHEEYQKLAKSLDADEKKLVKLGAIQAVDTSTLDKEISFARTKILDDRTKLMARDLIAKAAVRQGELEGQQTTMSQQIADLEQMQFSIETYVRTKVNMLEERINGLFELVRFKMFDLQINGQLVETCECSINGVPYSDLNRASKINSGLDIIRTLSKKYGIIAPCFIDNAESTNEFLPMECQMIKLFVIPEPPEDAEKRKEYIKFYEGKSTLLMK